MTIKAVLSCGVTPLSGSFKLDNGPTERLVRVGMAAAKILVSQIHMETLQDNASLRKAGTSKHKSVTLQ